jgi:hypothetical protein
LVLISVSAAFMVNIAYVETGRTTLATIGALVLVFGFRKFGWKGMVGAGAIAGLLAGVFGDLTLSSLSCHPHHRGGGSLPRSTRRPQQGRGSISGCTPLSPSQRR